MSGNGKCLPKKGLTDDMRIVKWTFVALFCLVFAEAKAQIDTQFSQYWALPSYYNPAASGMTENINLLTATRQQWIGIPGAPQAYFVAADMPFKFLNQRQGLGAVINSQNEGLFEHLTLGLQYSYKVKLWKGLLSFGVQAGMIDERFDGTKVNIPSSDYHEPVDDGIPTSELQSTAFDMSFGIWYAHKWFYAGVSVSHLNEASYTFEDKYETYIGQNYYFIAGSNIPIKNTLYEIQPSLMVKSTLQMTQYEISCRVKYNKLFWGGLSYRWKDAVTIMIGAEYKNFIAGYAYDYPTSAIIKASSGSHEVFLGYSLKLDLSDKNKNKHKSIRIM